MLNFIIVVIIIYIGFRIKLTNDLYKCLEKNLELIKSNEKKLMPVTISYDLLTERGYVEEIKSFTDNSRLIDFVNNQNKDFSYSIID